MDWEISYCLHRKFPITLDGSIVMVSEISEVILLCLMKNEVSLVGLHRRMINSQEF